MPKNGQISPFFSGQRVQQLLAIAQTWIGTPFYPHGAVKGAGVSCQTLGAEIYRECGLPVPELPRLSLRAFRVNRQSHIAAFIEGALAGWLKRVTDGDIRAGDFLLFELPDCEHSGVALSAEDFIHASMRGVRIDLIQDACFAGSLARVWRPLTPNPNADEESRSAP